MPMKSLATPHLVPLTTEARQIWNNRRKQSSVTGKVSGVGYHTTFRAEVAAKIKDGLKPDLTLDEPTNSFALDLLGAGLTRSTLSGWMKRYQATPLFYIGLSSKLPKSVAVGSPAQAIKAAGMKIVTVPKHLSATQRAEIPTLHRLGFTKSEIGRRFNVTWQTVDYHVKKSA